MTMRSNNAGYFIRQGLRGLSSHRFFTFAAIGIIAACLIVTGSVALVAVNLEYNLNQLMAENEILAYVEENYSEEETEKVGETLRDVPNVTDCTFVSREDALDSYLDGLEDDTLYTDLPATVCLLYTSRGAALPGAAAGGGGSDLRLPPADGHRGRGCGAGLSPSRVYCEILY